MKKTFRNIFLTVGLGTLIFTPMLIIENGLNDTMKSVLIWLSASILYGLSYTILDVDKIKPIFRISLHFLTCFAITIGIRCAYAYFENGSIEFKKLLIITSPIFVGIYILLCFYMKNFGGISLKSVIKSDTESEVE